MASSNPAFSNPAFQEKRPGLYPPAAPTYGVNQVSPAAAAQLEGMYAAPPAGAADTGRMTVEDTVWKTLALFGVLLVTAIGGWIWTLSTVPSTGNPTILPWIVGALGGFVLAMIVSFSRTVRPALIIAYAAFEGLFVGGISAYFEILFPGIVLQATLATLAVVGVTLALFASGRIRASARATKVFMIAMIGYLVFALLNVGLMLFGVLPANQMFGLYSAKVFGIPLGLIIGVFVVILCAYSLVLDFDAIQRGVNNGAPRQFAWRGAFGIMVTVVWLYVEMLRILAILRGNN